MPIKQHVAKPSVRPKTGEDVEYLGGHYVLHVRRGVTSVFKEGRYVAIDAGKLVLKGGTSKNVWVFDPNKPSSPNPSQSTKKFVVNVHLNSEHLVLTVEGTSEGQAKNRAVGIIARKLNTSIPLVQGMLKREPNKISVSLA